MASLTGARTHKFRTDGERPLEREFSLTVSEPAGQQALPRDLWADAQAQGSDHLDHERDITLAIHAAIPDLMRETKRDVIQAGSGCLMALARRFEWNSRAKPA